MPHRSSKPTRPRDANQLAYRIVQESIGEAPKPAPPVPEVVKNAAAVELGRLGGLKGGKARAESMTPEQRSEIAKKAAAARWAKKSS
ncbi:MAG: histone H1 [bacterium]|nr:histone H1 [bacterium]